MKKLPVMLVALAATFVLAACGTTSSPEVPEETLHQTPMAEEAPALPQIDGKQHWDGDYDDLIRASEMPADFVALVGQWRSPDEDQQVKSILAAYFADSAQCDADGTPSCDLRLTQEASLCQQLFDGYQPSITYLTSWNPGTKTWIFDVLDVYCPTLIPATAQRPAS